jgi:hypothetical protein
MAPASCATPARDGIPVPPPLFAQLDKLAADLQIKPLCVR